MTWEVISMFEASVKQKVDEALSWARGYGPGTLFPSTEDGWIVLDDAFSWGMLER